MRIKDACILAIGASVLALAPALLAAQAAQPTAPQAGSIASTTAPAQLSAPLAALLERLPADSPGIREELLKLSAADVHALCTQLVEPGPGTDARARYALFGLTMALADPGQEEARGRFIESISNALRATPPSRDPDFLLEQLEFLADPRAIPALAPLLANEGQCDRAAAVLINTGGEPALAALRQALAAATGTCRIGVINALARLGDTQSTAILLKDVAATDPALRRAALYALARSGNPAAREVLSKNFDAAPATERGAAADLLLICAARLAALEHADLAAQLCRDLLTRVPAGDVPVRCAALTGLCAAAGDSAVGQVLVAMGDANPEIRAAAITLAARTPGNAFVLAAIQAFDTAEAPARAAFLEFFRRRGDRSAAPTAMKAISDKEKDVRIAAGRAAAALQPDQAIGPLLTLLRSDQADERDTAQSLLVALPVGDMTVNLVNLSQRDPPEARARALEVIAARPPGAYVDALFQQAHDPDVRVRVAALHAIETNTTARDIPTLLRLLSELDDEELTAAGKALATTIRRSPDREAAVAQVVGALPDITPVHQAALLGVLGRVGGGAALAALRAAVAGEEAAAREATLRAFGEWPDAAPAAELLALAKKSASEKEQALALRAYVRMIGLDPHRPASDSLAMCTSALDTARRADEKRLVLAQLEQIHDSASLAALAPCLANPELRAEAAAATIGVAAALAGNPAAGPREALERVLALPDLPAPLRTRAEEALKKAGRYEGHITDWWVAGPYEERGKDAAAVFATAFPPEAPAHAAEWRKQPVADGPDAWLVDLSRTMPGDNRAAYLFTRIYSPAAQPARLELGSDDAIKAWLNDQLVADKLVFRGVEPAQDIVDVQLKSGWNTLLLKVVNGGGGWGACARVRSAAGKALEGVRVQAGEKP